MKRRVGQTGTSGIRESRPGIKDLSHAKYSVPWVDDADGPDEDRTRVTKLPSESEHRHLGHSDHDSLCELAAASRYAVKFSIVWSASTNALRSSRSAGVIMRRRDSRV